MRRRAILCAVAVTLVTACEANRPREAPEQRPDESSAASVDFEALADVVVGRLAPRPGERVLLLGLPGSFDPLVERIRERLSDVGAEYLGTFAVGRTPPATWDTEFVFDLAEARDERVGSILREADAVILLPGPTDANRVAAAFRDRLRRGRGRAVHLRWNGAYDLDGTELEADARVDSLYARAAVETDYEALGEVQGAFAAALRGSTVRVTSPAGTDLSFRVGERPVNMQDGDASERRSESARTLADREVHLPAGSVRVAPNEESVEGVVVLPRSVWNGEEVGGLRLEFRRGMVTSVDAASGAAAARAEMESTDPGGAAFGAFALGFNPLLAVPETGGRWIPFHGHGAGVVRLSLGDNTELGGSVSGPDGRVLFLVDATVEVDGDRWVENGRMVR